MNFDIDFKKDYLMWLNENIEQFKINKDTYRITLPFLDRNNDFIEIYIINTSSNNYILTDCGNTLSELIFSGIDFKSISRQKVLDKTIKSYGVIKNNENELFIEATLEDIPLKKHMLAQCIVKISDLFNIKENTKSLFLEDITEFFDNNDIIYTPDVIFRGKSSLPVKYDFIIPKYKNLPEKVIKVVNNLDSQYAKSILFEWEDVKEVRAENSVLYTFINNIRSKTDSIKLFDNYDVKFFIWNSLNSTNEILEDLKFEIN